jgi:hypothetical protein
MGASEVGEPPGDQVEGVEVALRLPRGVDGRGERVDERVHVGGGQVVLLVPGRGGQNDVGEQRRRRHPEVGADEEVEFPFGNVLAPGHVGGSHLRRRLCRHEVRVGTQQMLEEVLIALARRAQQVGPPKHQGAWPVLGGIDVLDREL